jgi:hypothetical protein
MAEVTEKEKRLDQREPVEATIRQDVEATNDALATGAAAICFLLAFTFLRGTEQLLLASLGGLLAGAAK